MPCKRRKELFVCRVWFDSCAHRYSIGDPEFDHLRARAEKKHPGVEPDVAIFQELVSSDHPLTNKIGKGGKRKLHAQFRHHEDDNLSGARSKDRNSNHVTSLYW
jgi:hypothetical protein